MEELTGGAAAPAEPVAADPSEAVAPPNPISTEPRAAEKSSKETADSKEADKKPLSTRDALKKAQETIAERAKTDSSEPNKKPAPVESAAAKQTAQTKPAEQQQTPAAQDQNAQAGTTQHRDAPSRFSNDAKAAWETAPEPVKAEVHRAIRELEQGFEKHRADAEAFNEVREFDQLAKSVGTTMKDAMSNYVGIERLLTQNPIAGFQRIAENMGLDLRQVAAAILGQPAEQVRSQQDATIQELRGQLAALQQSVTGTTSYIKDQRENAMIEQLTDFAAKPEHSRFEELADDIAFFITTKKASSLEEAYDMAARLNPAPVASPAPDLSAQTRKGEKSVSGAPSAGSDPVTRKPSTSIKDSLRRAAAQAG